MTAEDGKDLFWEQFKGEVEAMYQSRPFKTLIAKYNDEVRRIEKRATSIRFGPDFAQESLYWQGALMGVKGVRAFLAEFLTAVRNETLDRDPRKEEDL